MAMVELYNTYFSYITCNTYFSYNVIGFYFSQIDRYDLIPSNMVRQSKQKKLEGAFVCLTRE
jgi:hypothetical protein